MITAEREPAAREQHEPQVRHRPRLLTKRVTKRDDGRYVIYYEFTGAADEETRGERRP